jgi:hypothetical protein
MSTSVRLATSDSDRRAIYRLRYRVYVEDMGRHQTYADHSAGTVIEPLDDNGLLFAAFDGSTVIGTVRHNYSRHGGIGDYEKLYEMWSAGAYHPSRTCITTKLIVDPAHRGGAGIALAVAGYRQAVTDGMRFCFIDCNDPLVPLFRKLGYREHGKISHPEYGEVNAMLLDFEDIAHLVKIGSPFAPHALELFPSAGGDR